MFNFRIFSLFVVMMLLIFGFAAIPVLADSGGIKVDDDNSCPLVDKEANVLGNGAGAFVWLNAQAGADTSLNYEIDVQGNSKLLPAQTGILTFTQCAFPDDNYYWTPFTTPGVAGVYTLVVFSDTGDVISRDTWRQLP